jgi:hypothetical protein
VIELTNTLVLALINHSQDIAERFFAPVLPGTHMSFQKKQNTGMLTMGRVGRINITVLAVYCCFFADPIFQELQVKAWILVKEDLYAVSMTHSTRTRPRLATYVKKVLCSLMVPSSSGIRIAGPSCLGGVGGGLSRFCPV